MNTITKIALAAVGTITAGVGLVSAPYIADSFNPNIVAVEMGGNWDCSAKTYRPDFGSKIAGELSTFSRHDGRAVARVMVNEFGLLGGMMGTAYIANEFASACESVAPAPVAQAPAPVAPPVVAPAPQVVTYSGGVTFNGVTETASITRYTNDSSFRVTWSDGHEVIYTLINGQSVKIDVASRGSSETTYGSWNNKTGDLVVTTENGTTVIPMA